MALLLTERKVLAIFGTEHEPKPTPMTWDNLRTCTVMQHSIYEVLRKYPTLPLLSRNALKDTVLPRGGGPDGSQPIAVPKGTPVTCCLYLMHRREEEWGPDAEAFVPDRCKRRRVATVNYRAHADAASRERSQIRCRVRTLWCRRAELHRPTAFDDRDLVCDGQVCPALRACERASRSKQSGERLQSAGPAQEWCQGQPEAVG